MNILLPVCRLGDRKGMWPGKNMLQQFLKILLCGASLNRSHFQKKLTN